MDSGLIILVLVVFGIIGIISYIAFDDIVTDIVADEDIHNSTKANLTSLNDRFPSFMDGAFGLALGLFWILVIAFSFMVDSHPIFFVVSIVLLLGLLFGAGLLSNAYEEFETDSEYSTASAQFPITSFILTHLLIIMLAIGGSIALVLFAKSRIG